MLWDTMDTDAPISFTTGLLLQPSRCLQWRAHHSPSPSHDPMDDVRGTDAPYCPIIVSRLASVLTPLAGAFFTASPCPFVRVSDLLCFSRTARRAQAASPVPETTQ